MFIGYQQYSQRQTKQTLNQDIAITDKTCRECWTGDSGKMPDPQTYTTKLCPLGLAVEQRNRADLCLV